MEKDGLTIKNPVFTRKKYGLTVEQLWFGRKMRI